MKTVLIIVGLLIAAFLGLSVVGENSIAARSDTMRKSGVFSEGCISKASEMQRTRGIKYLAQCQSYNEKLKCSQQFDKGEFNTASTRDAWRECDQAIQIKEMDGYYLRAAENEWP